MYTCGYCARDKEKYSLVLFFFKGIFYWKQSYNTILMLIYYDNIVLSIIMFISAWVNIIHNNNSLQQEMSNYGKSFSLLLPLFMMVRRLFNVLFSDLWSSSRALSICRIVSRWSGVLLAEFIFALLVSNKVLLCLFELTVSGISFRGLWTLPSSIGACSSISGSSITEPRLSSLSSVMVGATMFSSPTESTGTGAIFNVLPWLLVAANILSR